MLKSVEILGDIRLYIIPSVANSEESVVLYERCFEAWREVWLPTLRELDGVQKLYSEGFTRQDFICALVVNDHIAGLCCFKKMNLKLKAHREDSWFAPWPQTVLKELTELYPRALVPSWLTVSPEFRRSAGYQSFNVAQVLSDLIGLNCLDLKMDIAFGTPRKDRSVNRLVTQAGAQSIVSDVLHHGVLVDLVAFFPESLRDHKFSSLTRNIWNNRIDKRIQPIRKEDFYESYL